MEETRNHWLRSAVPNLLLFAAVLVVYWPSLSADFIWDDDSYVTENHSLRSLEGLRNIWLDPKATPQYYPLAFTVFWIQYQLWGLWPLGYHLVNVLLHGVNAVLFARLLRQLQIPGSWLAATIFGLHPVHVESVTWVTELKNVLSLFFYLLSMLQLLIWWRIGIDESGANKAQSSDSQQDLRGYLLGCVLFVAALLSKTVTCSLPAVILLIICQKQGRLTWRDAKGLIPLFVIGLGVALITVWVEGNNVGATGEGFEHKLSERILIAGRAVWFYAEKIVWPFNLAFIYPRWTINAGSPLAWVVSLSALLLPVFMVAWSRKLTAPLVAILCFGGSLLPTLGFFNVYLMRYSFVADHFQYLASLSLISLLSAFSVRLDSSVTDFLGMGYERLSGFAQSGIRMMCVLILVAFVCLTWQRQWAFQNLESIWTDTLLKNPTCMVAHIHIARLEANRGHFVLAEKYYRDLLRFKTDDRETHDFETNLGMVLASQQRYQEAVEMFQAALKRVPDYFEAINGLGSVALIQGRYDVAISCFMRSSQLKPQNAIAHRNLGAVFSKTGQSDFAERELKRAIELDHTDLISHCMLATIFIQRGQFLEAERIINTTLKLNPDFVPAKELLQQIREHRK